jgi:hypothetical protein
MYVISMAALHLSNKPTNVQIQKRHALPHGCERSPVESKKPKI